MGKLSTVDLFIKVPCFVPKVKNIFNIKMNMKVVNDTTRIINHAPRLMPQCNSRGVIYFSNMFIELSVTIVMM